MVVGIGGKWSVGCAITYLLGTALVLSVMEESFGVLTHPLDNWFVMGNTSKVFEFWPCRNTTNQKGWVS